MSRAGATRVCERLFSHVRSPEQMIAALVSES